ncbi:MAG: family 16 glycoside hydrolase [Bacteroidales bacterium]
MKIKKSLLAFLSLILISSFSFAQDRRTLGTKIADLLAQMPAGDVQYTNSLMSDMLALGETGLQKICDMVIPAGTGDDTKPRYAIESFSRFISKNGNAGDKSMWEKICIAFSTQKKDPGVRDFFIKQLQQVGGDQTVEAMKSFLSDKENCTPAISAITAVGGKTAENILSESLRDHTLPCSAAVMNALAGMKSKIAVKEFIAYASDKDVNTKTAAYNALAMSGSPKAYSILLKAARSYKFRWERTGSTTALLNYARNVAQNGDLKTMDKICKLLLKKCNDKLTLQNKTAALETYVSFHGIDAMPLIFKGAEHSDSKFRNASINMTSLIAGDEVISKWIEYFPKATSDAKPEILRMLSSRRSLKTVPLLSASLSSDDPSLRRAAAASTAQVMGKNSAPLLVTYLSGYDLPSDQEAAQNAWKSIAGSEEMKLLKPLLSSGSVAAKKSVIELMAWSMNNSYFNDVLPFTSSLEETLKKAAFKALPDISEPGNQAALLSLLASTGDSEYIPDIQNALATAAGKISDPSMRSSAILEAMRGNITPEKLIPVLSKTGGRDALEAILKEFENGTPAIKDLCFNALSEWPDYSASSALFEICVSGYSNYKSEAFNGYLKQVTAAKITDEEKYLLLRKIMPFAGSAENKIKLLTEIGKLKNYGALFYVGEFLDDPDLSAAAAKAAMYIALPSASSKAGMYGNIARGILTRAVPKLSGPESEYDREMVNKYLSSMFPDEGFVPMFNGQDLSGWQGLVENPVARAKMKPAELAAKQAEADKKVPLNWSVKDGCIYFNGQGDNLCSVKEYGDFEMLVDWKISKKGDSGIYLRGTHQVQIWDTSRVDVGAQVGSGGLYNNLTNQSKPLLVADNPVGDWNTFRILMTGEKVSVWLNGILVVDNVTFENYWDHKIPIFPKGPIELQAHGTDLAFRDIYLREVSEKDYNLTPEEKSEGFVSLFNGRNIDNWTGDKQANVVEDGMIVVRPVDGKAGNLYTVNEYSDFLFRFEFQLTPAANNGIGIRAPLTGDAAYVGMEIQVIDNTAPEYATLHPYQYHGSVYGVIPAKREYLKPVGEWNSEEITAQGTHIKVVLNGTVIVDGDIAGPRDKGTMDNNDHPGLKNASGHIGFLGHESVVKFRNIRIKDLSK